MSLLTFFALFTGAASIVSAYDPQLGFSGFVEPETRSIDEIHQAALQEGGVVTVWHGGDETTQLNGLKTAFEARFPGMTLNSTVNLSKYHDVNLDQQLAAGNVYVDSIILQTLNDFPRWKSQGALMPYKPLGFESIFNDFKDIEGYFMGLSIIGWANTFVPAYINGSGPMEYTDYLKPQFKDKLVLTYPNDDDAVLYQFDLILKQYGLAWFDQLLAQRPRWVRGTATPGNLLRRSNGTYLATFTSSGLVGSGVVNITHPVEGQFVTWPQTGAILKDAPHPEGAKLLHSYMLSQERVTTLGPMWSVRKDIAPPAGFPNVMEMPGTNPTKFSDWMMDRAAVERLRFFFENKIGSAQGLSPLIDDL